MKFYINYYAMVLGVFLFLSNTNISIAQDCNKIQTAFTNSYANEKDKDYKKAIENLKSVYNKDSYEINLRLGWLNYLSGLYTESISYYKKAVEIRPSTVEARFGLAYPVYAQSNSDELKKNYIEILELDPKNSVANYRLGCIYYYKEKDYQSALKYFEVAESLYPFNYYISIMHAWTSEMLGEHDDAKELFNKSLMLSPNDPSAIEGLALIKSKNSSSISTDYTKVQAAFAYSYTNETAGAYSKAIDNLKFVYDEKSYEINLRLGWLCYLNEMYPQSIEYYKKAIAIKPLSVEARFGIAYPIYASKKTEDLKAQYLEILKIDPQNTIANYRLSCLFYKDKDYKKALKHGNIAEQLYYFDYSITVSNAWTNKMLEQYAKAQELFNKVLILSPQDKSALLGLSKNK